MFYKNGVILHDPKTTSLMTSVTKNPQPPTTKFFSSAD